MTGTKKKLGALLLAAALLLSVCGCDTQTGGDDYIEGKSAGKKLSQTAAADDIFTLNINNDYSLNPINATNTSNQIVCGLIYENMVELDNNYNVIPGIITSWEAYKEGSYWEFKIDTTHVFHDGTPVTADDVAYSFKRAMNSDRFRSRLSYVYGCSATSEDTIAISLAKNNMMFPSLLTIPVIKSGSDDGEYPVGSGPYTYAEDYKSLVKAKTWKGDVPVDKIYLAEYTGVDETISAFEDSLLDLVMNDPTAPTTLGFGSANEIRGYNTTNMHYIGFNMNSRIFTYDSLRFAMIYAFDRDYLVEQLGGFALAASLPVSPASKLYSKSLAAKYKYDLEQCRIILENSGLKDYDNDGFLEQRVGDELVDIEIKFAVCSASTAKVNVAKKFVSDMASLGLQVNLMELSWKDYKTTVINGTCDMYYAEARINPDFDPSKLLVTGGSLNVSGIDNEQMNESIALYLSAADDGSRQTACESMCANILNSAYFVPLGFEKHQMVTHRGVITGIKVNENNPVYDFANWTIDLSQTADESKEDE